MFGYCQTKWWWFIILKPRSEWPEPTKAKAQFVEELAAVVEPIPGNRYEFLQPIQMRFNELLAGVRAELAIKVFGDDFETLTALGKSINTAIANVEGIADVQVEQTTGLPMLTINIAWAVQTGSKMPSALHHWI